MSTSNAILQTLREEKDAGISGGLYHELQVRMAYNSNHTEGSTLTEDQTRMNGNGRVGRLVALKECLRHDIVPFLIEDRKKAFYYRGLSQWQNE